MSNGGEEEDRLEVQADCWLADHHCLGREAGVWRQRDLEKDLRRCLSLEDWATIEIVPYADCEVGALHKLAASLQRVTFTEPEEKVIRWLLRIDERGRRLTFAELELKARLVRESAVRALHTAVTKIKADAVEHATAEDDDPEAMILEVLRQVLGWHSLMLAGYDVRSE